MAMERESTDVVIVGGGPVGLLLACELGLAGLRPVVLERLPAPSAQIKANGLAGQVVRFLDHRGLYERFGGATDVPRPVPGYLFGALPLNLGALEDNPMTVLPVTQQRIEQVLAERARELGVDIRRGHEVTDLRQSEERATVEIRCADGVYELSARHLVGCDGGKSTVRKLAGIDFPGTVGRDLVSRAAYATLPPSMLVPETGELDVFGHGRISPVFTFTRTQHGIFAFAALPDGNHRLLTLEWGAPPEGEETAMTLDDMRDSVCRVLDTEVPLAPPSGPGPHMLRRLVGRNTRLAERYSSGRVFLAGDSAHVHSAVGGPGLNLGLQDAANLGWKLAAHLQGWAPPGLLDTYHAERHAAGRRVFMHTQAQTALMAPGPEVTALRELFGELLHSTDNVQRVADLLTGDDLRYETTSAHPLAGRFAPDLALETGGGAARLSELMRAARPVLLDLGADPSLAQTAVDWKDRVDVVAARCPQPPAAALLIRPDGYVAWAAAPDEPSGRVQDGLRTALAGWFG
ncbi:FAD-dependent monooxygenase [Streptomyces kunmingensis]|uniref:FAD-dependent monooxygenase n=1 Tax=Streptomyces kunmingensis TaxID=68225 RepID=A0ABU6C9I3_9ACTN|nr:FAD-dependent monooxygenase [Streptomyces kunmingensis]MEB3960827.1 FAD-dependent monooxygenase [Streptomyces kunmingensis]